MIKKDIWSINIDDIKSSLDFNTLFKLTKSGSEIKNIKKTIKSINLDKKLNKNGEKILKDRKIKNEERHILKHQLLEKINHIRKIGKKAKKEFKKSDFITNYIDDKFHKKLYNLDIASKQKKIKQLKKISQDLKSNVPKKTDDKRLNKTNKLKHILKYTKVLKDISYKYEVKYEKTLVKIDFLKDFWSKKDKLISNIKKLKENLIKSKKEINDNSKKINQNILDQKNKFYDQYQTNKSKITKSFRNKEISFKMFLKQKRISWKNFLINKRSIYLFQNPYKKTKKDLQTLRIKYYKFIFNYNKNLQLLEDEVEKKFPIEIKSWYKFVFAPLSIICPGIMYFYLHKWKIGLINLSIFVVMIFLGMYTLGFFNINGIGIYGLSTLGKGDLVSDSRFYVIEGTISIILLSFIFIYCFLSFRMTYYSFKIMEFGIRTKTWSDTKRFLKRDGFPYFISLPALAIVLFVVILPILATIIFSMTNYGYKHLPPGQLIQYVGLDNYKKLIVNSDISLSFQRVISWTFLFTIISSVSCIIVGIGLGILTQNQRLKGRKIFRFIFLLPTAIPSFITIMMIGLMFAPSGLISRWTGITTWKTEAEMAKIGIIIVQVWISYSASYLMTIGVINSIPHEQKEAATIDGVSKIKSFRHLVLPIILYQLLPLIVSTFMATFNNYAIIYLFTQGGPAYPVQSAGNVGQTDTVISWVFKLTQSGVTPFHGLAAALLMITTFMILPISATALIRSKAIRKEGL